MHLVAVVKYRLVLSAVLLAHWQSLDCARLVGVADPPNKHLTTAERVALIRRAQVWKATDVAAMDIKAGPPLKGAFAPGETVACDYVKERFSGKTPKFACAITQEDKVKVRYGRENGEVYAGVAATRLLWTLGFGADALYPVHVVCRGCPAELATEGKTEPGQVVFDVAAIERKLPGSDLETPGVGPGWAWPELDLVDERAGGAPVEQRDALKLIAGVLQHTDNKLEQQRLICPDPKWEHGAAGCLEPFMLIHDLGLTFGRANLLNRQSVGSVNLEKWATTPIWQNRERCIANLSQSQTGTLSDPVISESGRKFLANLLSQLSDRQLQDLFAVARFPERTLSEGIGGWPASAWVEAFKQKRDDVAGTRCP